eukprot:c165_g1_i2.p1 GENE.c165_g1_i2~~c165_g1_i2.p1  ORF type:complete len:168 (-),score=23.44 c165_g1_i2:16-519(-)
MVLFESSLFEIWPPSESNPILRSLASSLFACTGEKTGKFVLGDQTLDATLLDLPCITEAHKIIGKSTVVKSGDIGQIIVVHSPSHPPQSHDGEVDQGLTPAARQRWTRKKILERVRQPNMNMRGSFVFEKIVCFLCVLFCLFVCFVLVLSLLPQISPRPKFNFISSE